MKFAKQLLRRPVFAGFAAWPLLLTAAETSPQASSDEVVNLSPFEVSSSASRGYVTTSSLTASRIAVPITELPSTVITINDKLISDTVAADLRDTFNFVSGVNHGSQGSGTQEQNAVSLRGYSVTSAQRDGIPDRMMSIGGGFDYAFVDSVEIVKGPSGVLYGSHTPGGVINFISKRPLLKPRVKLTGTVGSFGSYRAEADISGFFDKTQRWGYRLATAIADTDGPLDFVGEPPGGLKVINPSVSYRTKSGLHIWAWSAFVRDAMKRLGFTAHAYQTGPNSGRVLVREADESHGNNIFRSLTRVNSDNYEIGLDKSVAWGPVVTNIRLVGRHYNLDSAGDRIRGVGTLTDLFLDAAGNMIGGDSRTTSYDVAAARLASIARQQIRFDTSTNLQDGSIYSADVGFKFEVLNTRHQFLAYGTFDKSDSANGSNAFTITNAAKLVALGAQLVSGQTRVQVWPTPAPQTTSLASETIVAQADTRALNTRDSDNDLWGFGAIERMSVFKDRLFLVGGIRGDRLSTVSTSYLNNTAQPVATQDDRSTTTSYAALAKLYDGDRGTLSLYYNDNQTFIPEFALDTRLGSTFGKRFPNRIAATKEFGLKVDTFSSRMVGTMSVYDTTENNALVSQIDQDGRVTGVAGSSYRDPIGARHTKGWDLDINISPAAGLELMFGYGRIDSRLDSGLPAQEQPRNTFSTVVRYERQKGWAKGASIMWMYSEWGRSIMGSRTNWWLPSGDLHTAIVGYRWREWDIRLRVENVLDDRSVQASTNETAVGLTRPRNFRLALTYMR